ncbi:hypothetical protein H8M03_03995 [Sphingomonas sabuli]|uniref:Uncharacterized protein n=1 Tax=Sphingomonas sabuli TaxID=2764186 RepID=A0A7G9L4F3_9SPHN|nr:hypothetical protein [Sphingomonas sabuli]QNM83502.1 hypothetical protein H8M03_03995 [Sphingomonas sabuli]
MIDKRTRLARERVATFVTSYAHVHARREIVPGLRRDDLDVLAAFSWQPSAEEVERTARAIHDARPREERLAMTAWEHEDPATRSRYRLSAPRCRPCCRKAFRVAVPDLRYERHGLGQA